MAEQLEVYKCDLCGNIVEVLHGGAGELVCCGEAMKLFIENTVDAAKEKHVPVIETGKDSVTVTVGKETPHPNTMEHHIDWIELFGLKNDGQVIDLGRETFAPTYTSPTATFTCVVPLSEFKALCALSYCNIHGLWENCLEV